MTMIETLEHDPAVPIDARYSFAGITLSSDLNLPGLDPAGIDAPVDVVIRCDEARFMDDCVEVGATTMRPDGTCVLDLPPVARVAINASQATIAIAPFPGIGRNFVRHVIVDVALPRYFALLGYAAVHATAVSIDTGTVAFLAGSGRGKSTLCGALVAQGGSWVADDFLLLDVGVQQTTVIPTAISTRLLADSAAALGMDHTDGEEIAEDAPKRRWSVEGSRDPVGLTCIIVLDRRPGPEGPVTCAPLNARDAMAELAEQWFLSEAGSVSPWMFLSTIGRLLQTTPMLRLSYPSSFDRLAETTAMIRSQIAARSTSIRSLALMARR